MAGELRSRFVSARARLVVLLGVTFAAFLVQPRTLPLELRSLVAWSGGVACFLSLALWLIMTTDANTTRRHCSQQDDNWAVFDVLLLCASVASLAGIVAALIAAGKAQGFLAIALTGTAVLAVILSWSLTHILFTFHYAHLFYYKDRGGIDFHSDEKPDYRDFLYVAVTIGVTFGVSDTDLTAHKMRRAVTGHSLLSFLFSTVIIALSLNVITSLLSPGSS